MNYIQIQKILKANGIKLKKVTKSEQRKFMYGYRYSVSYRGIEYGVDGMDDIVDTSLGLIKEGLAKSRAKRKR